MQDGDVSACICGRASSPGARFCEGCGRPLAASCTACGSPVSADAAFCPQCGAALAPAPSARSPRDYTPKHLTEKILSQRAALEGERKQVTVLFCDVQGSIGLAESLELETLHQLMDEFLRLLAEGVHRFEGTVNQYTGDGVMALFGAPIAHEDHAQRACHAALFLRDRLREHADQLRIERGLSFAVRMGLNSGEVVVGKIGDDARMDYTAQGPTVNLAARMEALAEPGRVYLTGETEKLARGFFEIRGLGATEVKGVPAPVEVYELEGVGAFRTRFDRARTRGLSDFVGRETELALIEAALDRAEAGEGGRIEIVGEPGVGKSRLCHELALRARARGMIVAHSACVPHGQAIPHFFSVSITKSFARVSDRDTPDEARRKVAAWLVGRDPALAEYYAFVCDFIGVPDPAQPGETLSAEARTRRYVELTQRMQALDAGAPRVVISEDLHWIDAASESATLAFSESARRAGFLSVSNYRPEYAGPLARRDSVRLGLEPLGSEATRALTGTLLGPEVPEALVDRIQSRAGGNPLFVEEIVLSLAESGALQGTRGAYALARGVEEIPVPAEVRDVLAGRIDRLVDGDKSVLQAASVIGERFERGVLAVVADLDEEPLAAALSRLCDTGLVLEELGPSELDYRFKHALTRDVAYGSALAPRRSALHVAAARALETLQPERVDERAALISQHLEQAGRRLDAARWYVRSALWHGTRDASSAVLHARHALEQIAELPEDERDSEEVRPVEWRAIRSIADLSWRLAIDPHEADVLADRARTLAPSASGLGWVLFGLNSGASYSGGRAATRRRLSEGLELARRDGNAKLERACLRALGRIAYEVGDLRRAYEYVKATSEEGTSRLPDEFGAPFLQEGFAVALLSELGRLDEARARAERAGVRPRFVVNLELRAGDYEAALRTGQILLASSVDGSEPIDRAIALRATAEALTALRRFDEALDHLARFFEAMVDSSAIPGLEPAARLALAMTHLQMGSLEQAREQLERVRQSHHVRPLDEPRIRLSEAELSIASGDARHEIEEELAAIEALVEERGARVHLPHVWSLRADLAEREGDAAARRHALEQARRLAVEIGAHGHAERFARRLAGAGEGAS